MKIMDLPPKEAIFVQQGLPNEQFSSDHVCVLCEFIVGKNEIEK
jgi:mRNA deadenylase 3'-5' endonuclease subunit Ccr4